ncbi:MULTISPECIES: HEPN domain-containing protein [Arthrobacter]|uniref:HEPN domain-containing protein n=1 Tax=Arthrobacter TaxID=1663 RepID=UPI001058239D|nr:MULTISPECIES: HEPN domain-containing protein [Arthrobacter]
MQLRAAALDFLGAAFSTLTMLRVLPVSMYHRYIRVGADYVGADVMFSNEFKDLEEQITLAFPERCMADGHSGGTASGFIFGFLEASIAELATKQEHEFSSNPDAAEEMIDELVRVLEQDMRSMVHCRLVSHLTTADGEPVTVGGVTLVPVPQEAFLPEIMSIVTTKIPMARQAFFSGPPVTLDRPNAIVIAEKTTSGDPFQTKHELKTRVERFLLIARLVTGATARSYWDITGTSDAISDFRPHGRAFFDGLGRHQILSRVGVVAEGDEGAFAALGQLIDGAEVDREGKVMTSFDMAFGRFTRSYLTDDLADAVVDLATSLEAILLGGDKSKDDIGLRLRGRAAALLSTTNDAAPAMKRHISDLYSVRSALVHGGSLKAAELRRYFRRIVAEPQGQPDGVLFARLVDRFRDLVRRAILARLALAAEPVKLWPFDNPPPNVDQLLCDDGESERWRSQWRTTLASIGLGHAGEALPEAEDY